MRLALTARFSLIALIFVSAASTAATTGGSEIVLFTPWKFAQTKLHDTLQSQTIVDEQKFASLNWQLGQWTPQLTGVDWTLKTKLSLVNFTPQDIELKSQELIFSITIQQLNIDQVIQTTVDGAILKVHVKAQCGPITMSQSVAAADVQLGFQVQPQQVITHLGNLNLTWPAQSWKVSPITCQGPQGFSQSMTAELTQDLTSPDMVKPWLQSLLAAKVQSEANTLMTELGNPIPIPASKSPLPLVLTFRQMQTNADGILNYGTLVWSGKSNETNLSQLSLNAIPAALADSSEPVFVAGTDGWSNLIQAQLLARPATTSINMNKISSFHELLSMVDEQLLVWPDLVYYTTYSPFTLKVFTPKTYTLQWQADGTANLTAPVKSVIQSVRLEDGWNYVDLNGSLQGKMTMQISAGKLAFAVKVSNSNFTTQFEPAYVKAFHPDTRIDKKVLQGFEDYVDQGFKYSTTLPTLNLGIAGLAQFNGWVGYSTTLIGIPMKVAAPSTTPAN